MANIVHLLTPQTHHRTIGQVHLDGRSLKQREIDRFGELGISAINLGTPWPVLADRVVFEGDFFHFADDAGEMGDLVFTVAIIGTGGGIIDIVAWCPRTNCLAVWLGDGFALGERQIHHPNPLISGLPVFRSPMSWLRNGRCGIVIVRNDFADVILAAVPVLIAEDEQHQRELQRNFPVNSPGPKIEVSQSTPIVTVAEEVAA